MKTDPLAHILVTGASGTVTMTAASALMSNLLGENFREPEHLETLIGRLLPGLSPKAKQIAAWGAHHSMGLMFASIYVELWKKKKVKRTVRNGLLLGAASGVLGYLIWKGTFKAHPLPRWLNVRQLTSKSALQSLQKRCGQGYAVSKNDRNLTMEVMDGL